MYVCFMGRNAHIPASDTQKFIIEQSAVLFNKMGYARTSLSDLEEVTGLTKGSIYANFKDKQEVALKVLEYNFDRLCKAMEQKISTESTAKGKLLACIDFYLEGYQDLVAKGGCAIQNALIENDDTNIILFERAKNALISWKERIADIVTEGLKADEFSTEVQPSGFAFYLIANIEGALLVSKSLNNEPAFRQMLTKLKGEVVVL